MMKRMLAAVALAAVVAGCGVEAVDSVGSASQALVIDDNTVVGRKADGVFQNSTGVEVIITESGPMRRYYVDWGYWIDLKVQNLAYDKSVGIVWTDDNWQTVHPAYAQYEGALENGYEQWGVDISGRTYSGFAPTVEYAAFADMNGNTYWGKEDNWKNYVIVP